VIAAARVPVIYSTDLLHPHDDPDDHFDLACLFSMPEVDLRAIVLDQGDRQAKRPGLKAVQQLVYLSGRQIPATIGLCDKLKSPDDTGEDQPALHQGGVQLILETLRTSPKKVVVIFVGSARDVVAAFNRDPALFKKKVRHICGFIGEASVAAHQEYNVGLDPQAFVGLMRADVPFYWIPCFDGGVFANKGHASFWKIKQGEVLEGTSPLLQRYFLYMLRKETNDPIAYLSQPTSIEDRDWLMQMDRNMWCGALLGLAVGRSLGQDGNRVVGFSRSDAWIDDKAVVSYGKGAHSRKVMRFEIKDLPRFKEVVTRATADLMEQFPLSEKCRKEVPSAGQVRKSVPQ
jgi:hypothetical protein